MTDAAKHDGTTRGLTFDERGHEYRLDGQRVPSVTQVLSDLLPGQGDHQ